jgi:hypothetical protein
MSEKVDLWVCEMGHVSDRHTREWDGKWLFYCSRCRAVAEQRTFDVPPKESKDD